MRPDLLDKIHSKGYWRVLIRPTQYKKERINSLDDCRKMIQEATLSLAGWNYPHCDFSSLRTGQNYIESTTEFLHRNEFWRFYQSGQFINHFSMIEDWQQNVSTIFGNKIKPLDFKGLEINSIIYKLTEIIEFTSRLAIKEVFGDAIELNIELFDTKDRKLFFWNSSRFLSQNYTCTNSKISINRTYSISEIIGNSTEIAMNLALYIFESFNFNTPPEVFKNDQKAFLKCRI